MGRRTLLLIAALLIAAIGTALIWLYVQGADDRAREGLKTVSVYTAGAEFQADTTWDQVLAANSPLKDIPQSVVPPDAITAITAARLTGKVLLQRIPKGIVLTESMFGDASQAAAATGLDPKKLAIQVQLEDPARVAGLLRSNSYITIFATDSRVKGAESTQVLLQSVRVLSGGAAPAQQQQGQNAAVAAVPTAIVTLELDSTQARKIIFTQTTSPKVSLWFGLRGSKDGVPKDTDSTTKDNLFQGAGQ